MTSDQNCSQVSSFLFYCLISHLSSLRFSCQKSVPCVGNLYKLLMRRTEDVSSFLCFLIITRAEIRSYERGESPTRVPPPEVGLNLSVRIWSDSPVEIGNIITTFTTQSWLLSSSVVKLLRRLIVVSLVVTQLSGIWLVSEMARSYSPATVGRSVILWTPPR